MRKLCAKGRLISCSSPFTCPSGARAGSSPYRSPCTGPFGARAGSGPCRSLCSGTSGARAGSGPCRSPCTGAFGARAGTSWSELHVLSCSLPFRLILHVGVSCSTQRSQAPPLACAFWCLLGSPRQPSCYSFLPPSSVGNLSPAASSPSLERIARKRDLLLKGVDVTASAKPSSLMLC